MEPIALLESPPEEIFVLGHEPRMEIPEIRGFSDHLTHDRQRSVDPLQPFDEALTLTEDPFERLGVVAVVPAEREQVVEQASQLFANDV
jgi:hypothetical protein